MHKPAELSLRDRDGKYGRGRPIVSAYGNTWAIALAGGEGRRLQSLTLTESGIAVPKQFCSLRGGTSLLRETMLRAETIAPRRNICTVVARQHESWWRIGLANEPRANVIVQPADRGTAIGILLAILHIMNRDADARVVLLPSDHYVRREQVLAAALQQSVHELDVTPHTVLVLGIFPEEAEPDLGYIVPGSADRHNVWTVSRFVEKPDARLAQALIDEGALWNSFIVAAKAPTLLRMFTERFPRIVTAMRSVIDHDPCESQVSESAVELYRHLPHVDFSRGILQNAESELRVLRVDPCGWSDLGTPKRLGEILKELPRNANASDDGFQTDSGFLSLAAQHERYSAGADPA